MPVKGVFAPSPAPCSYSFDCWLPIWKKRCTWNNGSLPCCHMLQRPCQKRFLSAEGEISLGISNETAVYRDYLQELQDSGKGLTRSQIVAETLFHQIVNQMVNRSVTRHVPRRIARPPAAWETGVPSNQQSARCLILRAGLPLFAVCVNMPAGERLHRSRGAERRLSETDFRLIAGLESLLYA